MSIHEEIPKAIAAHVQWRIKLRKAIDTGECESKPELVRQDDNCSFGKWLHYRIDNSEKDSAHYKNVVSLHAEFHKVAGRILDIALNGNKDQAIDLISGSSRFVDLSTQLTQEMQAWKESL